MTDKYEALRPAFERRLKAMWHCDTLNRKADGSYADAGADVYWFWWCAAFESLGEPVGHFIEADIEYGVEAGWMELNEHGRAEVGDKAVPLYRLPK